MEHIVFRGYNGYNNVLKTKSYTSGCSRVRLFCIAKRHCFQASFLDPALSRFNPPKWCVYVA